MKELIELLNQFEERIVDKERFVHSQCDDVQQSINRTFHQIFEQLIEIRRFCRNDIEQQTLNIQIQLQQIRDSVQYMRTKCLLSNTNPSELHRLISFELDRCTNQLSKLLLSPARDLDNLSSYLTASIIPMNSYPLPQTPPMLDEMPKREETIVQPSIDLNKVSQQEMGMTQELIHFKFGPSIVLAYPCDMIASNGRSILAYAIEKNFLNYSTVVGVNLSSIKVYRLLAPITANNARLWDVIWCPWSKFYLIVGNLGLYSLCYPYDTNPSTSEHIPQVNKLISFRGLTFQHVRVATHSLGWYVYMIEHQNVSIDLYDRRSGQRLYHFDNHIQHDYIPLGFHGFCLNENLFAIVKKIEVLSTINNPHQIENEQNVQVYFFDRQSMSCLQQISLCHCSNVSDIKCCYEKNIFMILAEPMQLILVNLDNNELIRKKLIDEGKYLCMVNDQEVFILRSECSIQTLQYRNNR